MNTIDPVKEYSLQEVVDNRFIPHVTGYAKMYNMVTERVANSQKENGMDRVLVAETSPTKIKPVDTKAPWNKISGKILVRGEEILKFLKIHGMIGEEATTSV